MRSLLVPVYLLLGPFCLALEPGDKVTIDALKEAEFIKGEAPKEWEKGKVYILVSWATWCGPCVAAIPHEDALYDKYHQKGLEIFGMNVHEAEKDIAADFVKKKGDGMSYPVAYIEKGGKFETEWLKKAGFKGIPHAFVVKDSILVMDTHPVELTEAKVEQLPDENLDVAEWTKKATAEARRTKMLLSLHIDFHKAKKSGDSAEIERVLERAKKIDPAIYRSYKSEVLVDGMVEKNDWDGLLSDLSEGDKSMALHISRQTDQLEDVKPELLRLLIEKMPKTEDSSLHKSRLYAKLGDRENALSFAKQSKKDYELIISKLGGKPDKFDKALDLFILAIKEDEPKTIQELMQDLGKVKYGSPHLL